jgi:hypothetical protein
MSNFDMNVTMVVDEETSSSVGSVYLPEGVYAFTVEGVPKAGFHQPKKPGKIPAGAQTRLVVLNVFHPEYPQLKGTFDKTLYGHETTKRAMVDFFVSLSMVENTPGAQFTPDWNTTSGREGRVFIKRKTYQKKDNGGIGYINEIAFFKAPDTKLSVLDCSPENLQRPTGPINAVSTQNTAPVAPPALQQAPMQPAPAPTVQQAPVQQVNAVAHQQANYQQNVVTQQVPPAPTAPPAFQG